MRHIFNMLGSKTHKYAESLGPGSAGEAWTVNCVLGSLKKKQEVKHYSPEPQVSVLTLALVFDKPAHSTVFFFLIIINKITAHANNKCTEINAILQFFSPTLCHFRT